VIALCLPAICEWLRLREYETHPFMIQIRVIYGLMTFCIVILPICLLLLSLIRSKELHPITRTSIIALPAILWYLPALSEGIFSPVSASGDFAKRMNHPLPPTAKELRAWRCHGRDSSYMYSFSTTSEDTSALLSSGSFKLVENQPMHDRGLQNDFRLPVGGQSLPEGWPDPRSWEGLELHQSDTIADYAYILTDKWHTNVLVLVGDT
jgi:hypothetical protein